MNDKLVTIFPPTLGYHFEKVREGLSNDSHRAFALANFDAITECFEKFRKKLVERGEEECVQDVQRDLEYPVKKVRLYLSDPGSVDQEAAAIFVKYIEGRFEAAKIIANEIDAGYEEKV
jgi:hypothetical protein